jgi:hypothetical protein
LRDYECQIAFRQTDFGPPWEIEGDVTVRSELTAEERNLLVRLPRWVVGAASLVHDEGATRNRQKLDNGFLAVANGRDMGNRVIADFATAAIKVYDDDPKASGVDPATVEGRDLVIGYAQTAMNILRGKADEDDAATYRRWLLDITDYVIADVRHERIGFGGVHVHPDEKHLRERLSAVTRATPPSS